MQEKTIRFDVPTQEQLDELMAAPLPRGLEAGNLRRHLYRDVYLDTADGDLERRGVVCRFRTGTDDRRLLSVEIRETVSGRLVAWRSLEDEVPELDAVEAIRGSSEPARRLRGVIDPSLLQPLVQFETEQWRRPIKAGLLRLTRFEALFERVTVRAGDKLATFQELVVRRLRKGEPSLEELVADLSDKFQLRPLVQGQLERALDMVDQLTRGAEDEETTVETQVAVLLRCGARLGFKRVGSGLAVASGSGSGEAAAQEVLRSQMGEAGTLQRMAGTVDRSDGRTIEVWLATSESKVPGLDWMPVTTAISRAGSPILRDPNTLAALSAASRMSIFAGVEEDDDVEDSPVLAREVSQDVDPGSIPSHFINVELAQLEFNSRVLELAEDPRVPLLARVRFLSIFSSNMDEFYMVRVGGLQRRLGRGKNEPGDDGLTPLEQLDAIAIRSKELVERQRRLYSEDLLPELEQHGVKVATWQELSEDDRRHLTSLFDEQIFPLLMPHAITRAPGHPFPRLPNLRLALAVAVTDKESGASHFGSIDIPETLGRFMRVGDGRTYVPVEEVVRANIGRLYQGMTIEGAYCFRVTRSGDLELDEQAAESLVDAMEAEVARRPFAFVVRLEVEKDMPQKVRDLLQRELRFEDARNRGRLGDVELNETKGMLDLSATTQLGEVDDASLDYPPHTPTPVFSRREGTVFEQISAEPRIVFTPYESFDDSVTRLLREAAEDADVTSIRLTLYRTSGRSAIIDALLAAADAGKQIDVFVELKARFDEERNVGWARKLEAAGIHVVTGFVKYKTHAKLLLITRREGEKVRRYVHVGTGNYNETTSRLYTDLGLLTSDKKLAGDVNDLFNEMTGTAEIPRNDYKRILVAPHRMLGRLIALIDRERELVENGEDGRIRIKVNGVEDPDVIRALYRASKAGVKIDMVVRGLCCLRPGVIGLSDRIRVLSILGRFLEHSRIFHFGNADQDEYYIGSADLRPRNLRRRVEVLSPVTDAEGRRLLDRILRAEMDDPRAWELQPDGTYVRRNWPGPSAQEQFLKEVESLVVPVA